MKSKVVQGFAKNAQCMIKISKNNEITNALNDKNNYQVSQKKFPNLKIRSSKSNLTDLNDSNSS